jgi:hypothetical protein
MPKHATNSNRRFWMFYSRYFPAGVSKILYTGLGAAGGTYIDILTGVTSSTATSYSDIIQGGSS